VPAQRFRGLLQLSVEDRNHKRLSGPIQSVEKLLEPGTLEALDSHFGGAYAIVLHDPAADEAIDGYLNGGSAAGDSGKSVMLLFEPVAQAAAPPADLSGLGLGEVAGSRPLIDFARAMFPGTALALPGILVLPRLSAPGNPLYVPLRGAGGEAEVTGSIRSLLAIIAAQAAVGGTLDTDSVGRALALKGIAYSRGSLRSPTELLLIAVRALWDSRKDLAAIIGAGVKLAAGKKG
jgi:hypothetical protein